MFHANTLMKRARKAMQLTTACQRCKADSVPLEVHHIDRDRANNSPANLMKLCGPCHRLEHIEAGDWGKGQVKAATCMICAKSFQPKRARRAKVCSPECSKQMGRISAMKRWAGGQQSPTSQESEPESQTGHTESAHWAMAKSHSKRPTPGSRSAARGKE
jgi:hypothetical protein